jgi:hypothetical protein
MEAIGQLAIIALGVLWPVMGAVLWFLIGRLVRAIDRLTDTVGGHGHDLVQIKTKIGIM